MKNIVSLLPDETIAHATHVDWIGRMKKEDQPRFFTQTLHESGFHDNPSDIVIRFSEPVNTGLRGNDGRVVMKNWIGYSLKATNQSSGSIGAYNGSICKLTEGVANLTDNAKMGLIFKYQ